MITTDCPTWEVLHQWLADTLPGAMAAGVGAHVRTCGPCQARLDQLSDDGGLRQWLADPPREWDEADGLARMRR
jgi:hypothetical protein